MNRYWLEKYSQIKVLCTAYASNLCSKMLYFFLKLVYQNKNELPGTSMVTGIISSFLKDTHKHPKSYYDRWAI